MLARAGCGFAKDCPRGYSAADITRGIRDDCAALKVRLEDRHRQARSSCERTAAGHQVLAHGGWCLSSGRPNVRLGRNQSYFLPKHHGPADSIVAGVLSKLLTGEAGGPIYAPLAKCAPEPYLA